MINLSTTYLGFKLRTPLVVSASPLTHEPDNIRRMEDAGASAIVLHSLFEEQVRAEQRERDQYLSAGTESNAESLTYFPDYEEFEDGSDAYVDLIAAAKRSVRIPIIASLNATNPGAWTSIAHRIEDAGADALELNLYSIPTDPDLTSADVESGYRSILASVKEQIGIPIAVKLSPFFTNLSRFAIELDQAGANGLVLFNRFYQPDIELETLDISPNILPSTPMAMRLPLRWVAMLHGRVSCSLGATSGIHRGTDALKMLMAGADVTMLCSSLMRHGIQHIQTIEKQIREWMDEHEYESVEQLKGSMSQQHCPAPGAFERALYVKAVSRAV
jgi:dihydroorotate dehydrogenase (fumarate)